MSEQLRDPHFAREYELLQPERAGIQALIDARKGSGRTVRRAEIMADQHSPNSETRAALAEYEQMKASSEEYPRYATFREAMGDVLD